MKLRVCALLTLSIFAYESSHACMVGILPLRERYAQSTDVLVGKVESVNQLKKKNGEFDHYLLVSVQSSYKGKLKGRAKIYFRKAGIGRDECDSTAAPYADPRQKMRGQTRLFFVKRSDGTPYTNSSFYGQEVSTPAGKEELKDTQELTKQ